MSDPSNTPSSASLIAQQPEDCNRLLLAALESGDLEASVDLYEPDAVLFKKSGEMMHGHEAIRQNNAFMVALKPRFTIDFIKTTVSADGKIATNRMKASFTGVAKDGRAIHSEINTLEVVRQQADGSWRFLIDDPFGSTRASLQER